MELYTFEVEIPYFVCAFKVYLFVFAMCKISEGITSFVGKFHRSGLYE